MNSVHGLPAKLINAVAGAVLAFGLGAAGFGNVGAQTLAPATISIGMLACQQAGCPSAFDGVSVATGTGSVNSFTNGTESFSPTGSTLLEITTGNNADNFTNSQASPGNNPFTFSIGGGGNSSTVTAALTPSPSLSMSTTSAGSATANATAGASAQVLLTYQFEVVSQSGAGGTAQITVNSVGTASAAATGSSLTANALTQLIIGGVIPGSDEAQLQFSCANGGCANGNVTQGAGFIPVVSTSAETGGFNETGTYTVNLGEVYTVDLNEYLNCDGATSACSSSIASVTITVPAGDQLLLSPGAGNSAPALVSAILPSSRSVEVGNTATAFATIINSGPGSALSCAITPQNNIPANFVYQTTDPATNALTGTADTPVTIAQGASQSFVIGLTPTAAFDPTTVAFSFPCTNSGAAPSVTGVNTLLSSASTTPVPDIVALAATLSNDGILHIPAGGANAFAVATVDLGSSSAITATANTGSATLPLAITLCQTVPATGACMAAPSPSGVTTTINANATPTFAIFATASGAVPFVPQTNRIFVEFSDANEVVRGSTSVAVETQ
jgi:hypothetical protein